MFLSRPVYDYSSQYVEREANDLGPSLMEIGAAGFRQMNALDNSLSRAWNYSQALDSHAERVKSLTGEDIRISTAPAGVDPIGEAPVVGEGDEVGDHLRVAGNGQLQGEGSL